MKSDTKRTLIFLALAFGVTWAAWGIYSALGIPAGSPWAYLFIALAVLGPGIGALFAYRKTMGMKAFLKYSFTFKQKFSYYAIFGAFAVWRYFLMMFAGNRVEGSSLYLPLLLLPICIFTGGNEEFGWRGFLQPQMEKKMGSVPAAFIFTAIWICWHVPLWFLPIDPRSTLFDFMMFIGYSMTNAFTLAAIYKLTDSVLLCVLFHAWANAITNTFMPAGDWRTMVGFPVEWAVSLAILVLCAKGILKPAKARFLPSGATE